jgi:DNA-binding CsgD family transcriptional regulator
MVAEGGTTRAHLRSTVIDDATWRRTWLYQDGLRPLGVEDRLVGAHGVTRWAESYFALDRSRTDRPFDDRARDVLALFLSGCPAFHREQLLVRGLLDASKKLSPREQTVLQLLLTHRSEAEIADALGLSFHTTHQYVVSVYRKFGVQGRAALAARWLRDGRPVIESDTPGNTLEPSRR